MYIRFFDKVVFYALTLRCVLNSVYGHNIIAVRILGGSVIDIFNALNLFVIGVYLICNTRYLSNFFGFFLLVGLLAISVVLSVILGPVFSGGKFIDLFKILSWMLYYPAMHIFLKKYKNKNTVIKIGIYCTALTIFIVLISQVFKIGRTAYDLGGFYIGYYSSESIIALTICSNMFFLINWNQKPQIRFFRLFFIMLSFVCSLLIMVRSAFLVLIGMLVSYYFISNKKFLYKILSAIIVITAVVFLIFYYVKNNPEYYETRFKDVINYSQSNSIESLGSGRVSLIIDYWKIFSANSFEEKFFGLLTLNTHGIIFGTHNDMLQILFLSGYFGLSIYLLIWLSFIIQFIKNFSRNRKEVNILYLNVFFAYFIFTLRGAIFQIYPMIVLMLMLAVASNCSERRKDESRVCK